MRVLLVVPAFNEARSLDALLDEIGSVALAGVSITTVVVDDGSRDRTADIARARGVRTLVLCGNLGIGAAVQSGLRLAAREGFDFAVQIDGDGQHPPGEIAKLLEAARATPRADLVVGTRYRADTFRSTWARRLGSWWLRGVLRFVAGVRVSDPTSGFRLYGTRALRLFDATYPYDFPEPESLAIARKHRLAIAETPVEMRERQAGSSSIAGLAPIYYMLKVTLAIVLSYTREPRDEDDDAPGR